MQSLKQVLEAMQPSLGVKEPSKDTLPMPQPGLTNGGGSLITPQANQQSLAARDTTQQSQSEKPSIPSTTRTTLSTNLAAQDYNQPPSAPGLNQQERFNLGQFILQCFDSLDTYGKTPDQLKGACKIFIAVLSQFPMDDIVQAFNQWVMRNSKMPTPADIVNIIDPPPPKPDWAAYVAIRQKIRDGYTFVMDEERAYLRYCERYSMDNLKSYEERKEAQEQLAEANSRLLDSPRDDFDASI